MMKPNFFLQEYALSNPIKPPLQLVPKLPLVYMSHIVDRFITVRQHVRGYFLLPKAFKRTGNLPWKGTPPHRAAANSRIDTGKML